MAFVPLIILEGEFKVESTSYKSEVSTVELLRSRDTVELPATFGGPKEKKAGARENAIRINVINDLQATSLWAELWAAMDTETGELAFEVVYREGAVSATNPKFSGTMVVLAANIGGDAGGLSTHSVTFPIKGDITKAVA